MSTIPINQAFGASDASAVTRYASRNKHAPPVSSSVNFGRDQINFAWINSAAVRALPTLLHRWCPDGKLCGREYVMRNPRRADNNPGSFSINMNDGKWADFAAGPDARGGDVISFAAYIHNLSQGEAARRLSRMLGLDGVR